MGLEHFCGISPQIKSGSAVVYSGGNWWGLTPLDDVTDKQFFTMRFSLQYKLLMPWIWPLLSLTNKSIKPLKLHQNRLFWKRKINIFFLGRRHDTLPKPISPHLTPSTSRSRLRTPPLRISGYAAADECKGGCHYKGGCAVAMRPVAKLFWTLVCIRFEV